MSPSVADALNVARSLIGVCEVPPGSNCSPITDWFGPVGGMNCYAWCAADVSYVLDHAGVPYTRQASCWFAIQRFKDGTNGEWLGKIGPDEVRPGDQGFLGSVGQDHTFLIEAVDGVDVITLEGNWGNCDRRMRRSIASIYGFGRPSYDGSIAPDVPPPSATSGRAVLRQGNVGVPVGDVQRFLNAFDNAGLQVDDDFGAATDAAVRAWQSKRGLTVDGEVGPQTWADFDAVVAYVTALAQSQPVDTIPTFPGTVRLGSRGDAVRQVQQRLRDRGWTISVDGGFGHETDSRVRQFQADKGLVADGIAGPATWVALWTSPVT